MTTAEFSNEFDILYNNVMSNQAPGLDEYEKSVFLTKAQDEVLKNYFNPAGNKYQQGFDGSPKRQIDFSMLIDVCVPLYKGEEMTGYVKTDPRSLLFLLPKGILIVLNESAQIEEDGLIKLINIVPISFDEYANSMSKPYKQPLKNQAWRLLHSPDTSVSEGQYIAEVVFRNNTRYVGTLDVEDGTYRLRYLRRPNPIILVDLKGENEEVTDVTIDGKWEKTECELDPILHPEILQRAVELAKSAYTGDLSTTVQMGQRSE